MACPVDSDSLSPSESPPSEATEQQWAPVPTGRSWVEFVPEPESVPAQNAQPKGGESAAETQRSRRRSGRPPAGELKRSRRVNLSLSEDEYAQWEDAAEGAKLSVWAREIVNSHVQSVADERAGRVGVAEEVAGVRAAMTRIGSNINQIARSLNAEAQGGPVVDRDQVADDLAALREGQDDVRELLRRLGR